MNNNWWAKVVNGFLFANFATPKFSYVLYVAQEREGNFNNKMHNCYIASYYLYYNALYLHSTCK